MRLGRAGRDVLLVERNKIGGQCLHSRCMVTCALTDAARTIRNAESLHERGIIDTIPSVSFPDLINEMGGVQEKIASVLEEETRRAGVGLVYGREGRLEGATLYLDDEETPCDAVIAATGSLPVIPDLDGISLPGVYTYQTMASCMALPERLVIVGGGIAAAEFAYIFSTFGSEVTVITRNTFLKGFNEKMRQVALRDLKGVRLFEETDILAINGPGHVSSVMIRDSGGEHDLGADAVLIAAGLIPRSDMLHGLEKGSHGEVVVDRQMRTSVEGVYACGDVTGPPYLTPVARKEGMVAADHILGRDCEMDYTGIPSAMNLTKDYVSMSLHHPDAVTLTAPAPVGPGSFWEVSGAGTGMAQIEVNAADGRLTGIAAAAPGAAGTLSYLSYLVREGCTVFDFDDFVGVHPSSDGVSGLIRFAADWLKSRHPPE